MTLTYCFLQKRKYLQKLLTLSLHTIKSFQIGKHSPKTSSARIFIFLSS